MQENNGNKRLVNAGQLDWYCQSCGEMMLNKEGIWRCTNRHCSMFDIWYRYIPRSTMVVIKPE